MSNIRSINLATEVFQALSNPNRLKIVLQLAECCIPGTGGDPNPARSLCVMELGSELSLAPSTLSHHLKELKRSGLVSLERDGRFVRCTVNPDTASAVQKFLEAIDGIY